MEESLEKAFIIMNKGLLITALLAFLLNAGCKSDDIFTGDCFVPEINVNYTINMDLPEYFNLRNLGEYLELDGGNKGVYLIHDFDDNYVAIERTCTYQSDNSCARVVLDDQSLQLRCGSFDSEDDFMPCCASSYSFNGSLLGGPSRCRLKTYRLTKQGNTLYIAN
jgi:hypothetical protein